MKAKTLTQVNKAIQIKYLLVSLVKGKGYFYLVSSDERMALSLAALKSTSIAVYSLNQMSVERWVQEVDLLMKG